MTDSRPVNEWADRSRYWLLQGTQSGAPRRRREREVRPLILTGHGLSIRLDKSCLLIRDGNTHYPAERRERRFFRGALENPPRIIALGGSGNVTLDALDWMAQQGIAFVRINYDGTTAMALSPSGYSTDPEKVRWQLETRDDSKRQLEFGAAITRQKLEAAKETLTKFIPESKSQLAAIRTTETALADLPKARSLSVMLSIEGKAALAYWTAWRDLSIRWKSQSRYPVPDEWKTYLARSSLLSGEDRDNRRATNPINAMLNYAYAVLLTEMRIKAIADGYDPTIGIVHDRRIKKKRQAPSFALDLMEPLRPVVDRAVLKLVRDEAFSGADFVLQSDGVCRLNPELARRVASAAITRIER